MLVNAKEGKCDVCSDKLKRSENGQDISSTGSVKTTASKKKSRPKQSDITINAREKMPSSPATASPPSLSTREESGVL